MKKILFFSLVAFAAIIFLLIVPAMANAPQDNVGDSILTIFQNAANQWLPLITAYAQRLFWLLAILDFVYMGIVLALRNGDLYDFVFNLVRKIMFFGFFYALLLNGNQWMMDIINSFRTIAANVPGGAGGISPDTIIETAFDIFMDTCQQVAVLDPKSWVIGVMGIGVVIFGALMTVIQIIALAEMYISIVLGQILLGFGGSEWSKDYAVSFVKYIIAVGMKLMAIQLIAALANNMFTAWANIPVAQFDLQEVAALAVAMMLLFFIMKSIPEIVSGIISGGQFGGANPVSILAAGTAMAAGVATAGIGMMAGGAGGAAKAMAVLKEASQAPGNTGGITGALSTAIGAGVQTFKDNIGKPQAMKTSLMGGTYANLRESRQNSELNNLDKGE